MQPTPLKRALQLVVVLALSAGLKAAAAEPTDSGWQRLTRLEGRWQAKPKGGAEVSLSFRLVSRGSTLVESYVTRGTETLTVFHPDAEAVVATHYCAQGNQPRLALVAGESAERRWVFAFRDATNLAKPSDSHLVRLEIELVDEKHLTMTETYVENGTPDVTTLSFTRLK